MSKFYKVDIRGKNWLQRVSSVPAWTADDEGRILYDESDGQVKYGDSAGWNFAGAYNDVPLNTILLVDSDTAITGYSLLTSNDDDIVYITKGSAAGGEAGGTAKSGSTWTQPNHQHSVGGHTHPVSSHNHTIPSGTVPGAGVHRHPAAGSSFLDTAGSSHGRGGDSYGTRSNTGYNSAGSSSHDHGGTTGNSTATASNNTAFNTGNGATANTWRPKGRNFTRQQRT